MKEKLLLLIFFTININCSALEPIKPWTILIYIAGDNDLEIFIDSNVKDMLKIGSNQNYNLVLCVARCEGKKRTKKLKYILIEKNNQKILFEKSMDSSTDSGQEETLRNFCTYAITYFPAQNYGLIFWDHGTGPLDPSRKHITKVSDTLPFTTRSVTTQLASLPILTLLPKPEDFYKAVCFDDSTGNFLTEKKLNQALNTLCKTALGNKKFALIGFDACLMAHVETASLLKKYAHYMVASQEIEPGAGWNYQKVFSIFNDKIPTALELGQHIVSSYKKNYYFETDLTLSCVDLEKYSHAEKELQNLITFLQKTHLSQGGFFIKSLLKTSSHKKNCTHFDEPEYIDIIHFLENLLYNFKKAPIKEGIDELTLKSTAEVLILKIIFHLQHSIVANTAGKDFTKATGLSIYFPKNHVNTLYKKNTFCCATQWAELLQNCL